MIQFKQPFHKKAINILKDCAHMAGFKIYQGKDFNGYVFDCEKDYAVAWKIKISQINIEISTWSCIWDDKFKKYIKTWDRPRWSIRNKMDAYSAGIMIKESLKTRAKRRY